MTGSEAIQEALLSTKGTLEWFVADFSDTDLLVRPVPEANHAAWQIGNVITGDVFLVLDALPDAKFPDLPVGFAEVHGSKGAKLDDPEAFLTKEEYLKLFDEVRAATVAIVAGMSDADLDAPNPGKFASMVPTMGKMFTMVANHTLMHAGQISVIRRKLGKPVLF